MGISKYDHVANIHVNIGIEQYKQVADLPMEFVSSTLLWTEKVDSMVEMDLTVAMNVAAKHVQKLNEAAEQLDELTCVNGVKWPVRYSVSVTTDFVD